MGTKTAAQINTTPVKEEEDGKHVPYDEVSSPGRLQNQRSIQSNKSKDKSNPQSNKSIKHKGINFSSKKEEEKSTATDVDKSVADKENVGWFHGKVHIERTIHLANNYKLQLFMTILFLSGIVCSIVFASYENVSVGVVAGGTLTIIACFAVIYTYIGRASWRTHPNPLIFNRSCCDLGLVFVILSTEVIKCTSGSCRDTMKGDRCDIAAAFSQFFLFASESWFFVMAIDMLRSIRSPFTDFKSNMQKYHFFVWGSSIIIAIGLVASGSAGSSEFGYCWTKRKVEPIDEISNDKISTPTPTIASLSTSSDEEKSSFLNLNIRSWFFFYIWLITYWVYAIGVTIFAWKRLKDGLAETLRMRLRVLHSVTLYVITIIIYWALAFGVYAPFLIVGVSECTPTCNTNKQWLSEVMNFMITCRGFFDFIVWFQINDLSSSNAELKNSKEQKEIDVDVDLSPQVNLALRCEVLYYTTTGIIQAVRDTDYLPPGATQQELYLQPQGSKEIAIHERQSLEVDTYLSRDEKKKSQSSKEKGTLFVDFCPQSFKLIREHFGISKDDYCDSLSKTTKERLSEGASGAFMFYSHDEKLIVKSMNDEEAHFLCSIASDYASYLLNNPDSLLTRFYGCHAIKLYGNTFYFVVMANLFATDKVIHRRYDIKGSWTNRSAKHPSNGKKVTCRHCNASYIFGAHSNSSSNVMNCPKRVGKHEPNVVLKDNDLTAKVRLNAKVAEALYYQLLKDANFLSRLGIMDYSLLMGVHNVEYRLNNKREEMSEEYAYIDPNLARSLHHPANHKNKKKPGENNISKNGSMVSHGKAGVKSEDVPILEEKHGQGLPRIFTGTRRANTVVGPSCYYFGVIDILQTWSLNKRLERFIKINGLRQDPDGISAVPPTVYKDRFSLKIADILGIALHDEYDKGESEMGDFSPTHSSSPTISPYGLKRYM